MPDADTDPRDAKPIAFSKMGTLGTWHSVWLFRAKFSRNLIAGYSVLRE